MQENSKQLGVDFQFKLISEDLNLDFLHLLPKKLIREQSSICSINKSDRTITKSD